MHPVVVFALVVSTLLLLGPASLAAPTGADPQVSKGLDEFARGQFAEAIADWTQAADTGNATAALYLGVTFDAGQGAPQSDAEALRWYERAAAGGNASAMFNVGVMFDNGHGMPVDRAEAARWYGMAADRDNPRAEYNLGLLYESGDGVARNPVRAAKLFSAAAGHGLTAALSHLARLGHRFAGPVRTVQPDREMADFARAQQLLLARGTKEAAAAAAELFRRAGLRHDALAAYDYAYCLDAGLGVPEDKMMAYVWYLRAARDAVDSRTRELAAASADGIKPRLTASEAQAASRALDSLR